MRSWVLLLVGLLALLAVVDVSARRAEVNAQGETFDDEDDYDYGDDYADADPDTVSEDDEDEWERRQDEMADEEDDYEEVDVWADIGVWRNTELTTNLWRIVSSGDIDALEEMMEHSPKAALARAEDGRGPLFWAYEYGQPEMVELLLQFGADNSARDSNQQTPADLADF